MEEEQQYARTDDSTCDDSKDHEELLERLRPRARDTSCLSVDEDTVGRSMVIERSDPDGRENVFRTDVGSLRFEFQFCYMIGAFHCLDLVLDPVVDLVHSRIPGSLTVYCIALGPETCEKIRIVSLHEVEVKT